MRQYEAIHRASQSRQKLFLYVMVCDVLSHHIQPALSKSGALWRFSVTALCRQSGGRQIRISTSTGHFCDPATGKGWPLAGPKLTLAGPTASLRPGRCKLPKPTTRVRFFSGAQQPWLWR